MDFGSLAETGILAVWYTSLGWWAAIGASVATVVVMASGLFIAHKAREQSRKTATEIYLVSEQGPPAHDSTYQHGNQAVGTIPKTAAVPETGSPAFEFPETADGSSLAAYVNTPTGWGPQEHELALYSESHPMMVTMRWQPGKNASTHLYETPESGAEETPWLTASVDTSTPLPVNVKFTDISDGWNPTATKLNSQFVRIPPKESGGLAGFFYLDETLVKEAYVEILNGKINLQVALQIEQPAAPQPLPSSPATPAAVPAQPPAETTTTTTQPESRNPNRQAREQARQQYSEWVKNLIDDPVFLREEINSICGKYIKDLPARNPMRSWEDLAEDTPTEGPKSRYFDRLCRAGVLFYNPDILDEMGISPYDRGWEIDILNLLTEEQLATFHEQLVKKMGGGDRGRARASGWGVDAAALRTIEGREMVHSQGLEGDYEGMIKLRDELMNESRHGEARGVEDLLPREDRVYSY